MTVTDSGNGLVDPVSAVASFAVVVRAAHAGPQLAPVGNQAGSERQTLAFSLRANDADSDALTFRMSGAPDGAALDPVTGQFSWTPGGNQAGSYTITFSVTDGHSVSIETVTLAIANANQPPTFVPMGVQLVREGSDLVFRAIATDADGDPVQLSVLSGMPQGALFEASRGEFQWTPGFDQQGDHLLRLQAVDPS